MTSTNTRARGYESISARVRFAAIAALTLACSSPEGFHEPPDDASSGGSAGSTPIVAPGNNSTGGVSVGIKPSGGAGGGSAGTSSLGGGGAGGAGGTATSGSGGAQQGGSGGSVEVAEPVPGNGVFDQQVISGLKAAVEHLYTFDGTGDTVADSKGDADGTLHGWDGGAAPPAVQSGGDLNFSANNAYVDLGAGFITEGSGASNAVSIEAFITISQPVPFARLYDFGTQEKDAKLAPLSYMFMAPSDGAFPKVVAKGAGGEEEGMISQKPLPRNQMVHIVVTYQQKTFDDGDTNSKTEVFLWINTQPVVAGRWRGVLSELSDVNCWLNRSQYPDGGLNAKLHEFRVYGTVLNQQQVLNSFYAGIDALNP